MRYPYERFLLFLVSRKVSVDKTIGKYGLPTVGAMWEAECRSNIRATAPHSVVSHIDSSSDLVVARDGFLDWAEDEGILPFWRTQDEFGGGEPEPELDTAIQIFVNSHARGMVGLLLLSKASDEEVLGFIQRRFDSTANERTLELYKKIFWDITLLKREDWKAFIPDLEPQERHYISLGLSSPSIHEAKRFLDEAPGYTPEQIINKIMTKAAVLFEAAANELDPEAAGAIRWAELSLRAISVLGTHKKAFGGDEAGELSPSEFQNMFSVSIEKIEHVSLAELQGVVAPKTDVPDVGTKTVEADDA